MYDFVSGGNLRHVPLPNCLLFLRQSLGKLRTEASELQCGVNVLLVRGERNGLVLVARL